VFMTSIKFEKWFRLTECILVIFQGLIALLMDKEKSRGKFVKMLFE
jgi:hypothetical protein